MVRVPPRDALSRMAGGDQRIIKYLEDLSGSSGGGSVSDGDKGDIVVSGGGASWALDPALAAALVARASHTGTQLASTISDFSEAVDDRVSGLLVAGSNITLTYNDGANTLTIASVGGGAWGGITGTLSAQTDLQAALDAKVDLSGDTMTGPLVTAAPAVAAGFMLTPGASDPSGPTDGEMWRRTSDLRTRIGGTSYTFTMNNGSSTFTGKKTFTPSIAGSAYLNVAHGVAPSAPVDGDIWTETTGVYAQVNGVTKQLDAAGGGGASPVLSWVI